MRILLPLLLVAIFLGSCIGTDEVDDPVVAEKIEIVPDRIALLVGTSTTASATFFNTFGIAETVALEWEVVPSNIASVDPSGLITALSPGQAKLFVKHQGVADSVRIAVVIDENAAASVDISAAKTSLALSETISLSAVVKNIDDMEITTSTIEWKSSDEDVITIDTNGQATGVGNGLAKVFAIVDGVFSNEIEMMVGAARIATFVSANGYDASGTAELVEVNGDLVLMLNEDFMTDFALGTFIYMANSNSSGTSIKSNGIELGEITTNGSHMFNITEKFPDVTPIQFRYVIVLCKPASVVFGYADFN
ncbi:MAG: Ig-like domain-containing protein [Cyclobacteriaceae bacterium]